MLTITRREVIAGATAAAATPFLPVSLPQADAATTPIASPAVIEAAEMFYTEDEPWGVFVRKHVSEDNFRAAALQMLDRDSDARENAEDWFFEESYDDDDNRTVTVTRASEHLYMRVTDRQHPELGTAHAICDALAPGAIPITVVLY